MRCEVAIVGGGPAGAACALRLARAGVDICVIERAQFPRTKACGEYLSAGSVEALDAIGIANRLRRVAHPLNGIRLSGKAGSAQLRFASPGWSVPRATLDAAILDAAVDAGARHVIAHTCRCTREPDGVKIAAMHPSGERMEIDAEVVVGADGAHSTVAREMNLSGPQERSRRRFAVGGHYTGLRGLDGHVEMFLDGPTYFAINPLGDARANVMLVLPEEDLRRGRDDVDAFVRERIARLTGGRVGFERAVLDGKRIAIGPLNYRARRYCGPRVLLAGDAAQFLDPFTGQGVYVALRSAELAARAVSARIAGLSTEALAWDRYDRALRRELTRRRRLAALVSMLVRSGILSRAAAALARTNPRLFNPVLNAVTGVT